MPQRNSLPLTVYRNGVLNTDLEVIDMQESAGVERLDTAHLLYWDRNLEGREFHTQIVCEEVEIIRSDTSEVLHWGKTSIVPPQLNQQGEQLIVVNRTEKFHLGERVNGIMVWNPIQSSEGGDDPIGGPEIIDHELVFNPVIDGKVSGNMNSVRTSEQDEGEEIGHPLFLNPESMRSVAAIQLQSTDMEVDIQALQWPLSKCIHYLLQMLNWEELYVANPTLATIEDACNDEDDLVLNTHIPVGTYLADALDLLLDPLGYRWKVLRPSLGTRVYAFYNRRAGDVVQVRHQAIGSTLSMNAQNVEAVGMTFDVSNLFNQITIKGGHYSYEVSVELHRGWATYKDDMLEAQYAKSAEGFAYVRDAWRKWVLNEAGDYNGLREEIDGVFNPDFRAALEGEYGPTIWNEFTPCRRKFGPTLTLDSEGNPIGKHGPGIELEYYNVAYDPENAELGPEWKPIDNWGVQVLDHECSIYFDGEFPPLEQKFEVDERSDIRLRATFTLVSDHRLEATAVRQEDSPQTDVAPLVVDALTKFRHQVVSPISKYYNSGRPSLQAIDNTAIEDFAVRVRETWDLMDVGGAIQLEGLDANDNGTTYQVGQRVSGILGKNLSFEAKAESEEYPQIVAIERNVINQTTTLHLQRIKRPISFGGDPLRRNNRIGGRRRQ